MNDRVARQIASLIRAYKGGTLDLDRLVRRVFQMGQASLLWAEGNPLNLYTLERQAYQRAMELAKNDAELAAQILGVGHATIYRMRKRFAAARRVA